MWRKMIILLLISNDWAMYKDKKPWLAVSIPINLVTYNDKLDTNIYESIRNMLSCQSDVEKNDKFIINISNDWAMYKEKHMTSSL